MTARLFTSSGKPVLYPSGRVAGCVLCGVPADDTWDGLAMCGTCEGEMAASVREPSTRSCCDCGDTFTPAHERARRCGSCAAVKYLG